MGNVINIYGMSPLELLDTFRMPLSVPISIDSLLQRMRIKVLQNTFDKAEEEGHYLFGSVISASVVQPDGLFFFIGMMFRMTKNGFCYPVSLHICVCMDEVMWERWIGICGNPES